MAQGFAYMQDDGMIIVETVSPTERAVKVNTIVTGSYGNVVPRNDWSDEQIDLAFLNITGGEGHVVPVTIETATQ